MSTTSTSRPAPAGPLPAAPVPARDPRWVRPAVLALLLGTAALYLVGLSASGWANPFYAAAAQAGSRSWEAWFYGSSDAANAITVDKPPAALWVTGLSVRVFGLSSWSILVPQALEGVAAVGLLYGAVRRFASPAAGLLAGLALAITPVAALMFRFDNPDALLVLLEVAAARGVLKAVGTGRARSLVWAGVFLGLGFLTKQLQVFLVLPGLALAYLWAAPHPLGRRVRHLLLAGGALLVAGGWWVAVVELVPASWRPYVGGSQDDSFLELTFGYNGLGRLTGDETGSVGANGHWGRTGVARMFSSEFGGNISWLVPAAVLLGAAGFVLARRAPRTDGRRAAYLVWAGWALVTGTAFSFMSGIIHPYYSVALAPPVAALVGLGAVDLWRAGTAPRAAARRWALPVLGLVGAVTTVWAFVLLGRSPDFVPWLRWVVLGTGALGAGLLTGAGWWRGPGTRSLRLAGAAAALLAGLAGPAAYTAQTVSTPHTGAIVSAGPTVASGTSGAGGPGGGGGAFAGMMRVGPPNGTTGPTSTTGQTGQTGQGGPGGPGGQGGPGGRAGAGGGSASPPGTGGGMGGLIDGSTPGAELTALLEADAGSYTWVAAVTGSNNAAGYQLATQDPVMAVGGFNGTDPAPTLAQFQQHVADGEIHYYVASSSPASTESGGSDAAAQISAWVAATFTGQDVDGTTVYDLSAAPATSATAPVAGTTST